MSNFMDFCQELDKYMIHKKNQSLNLCFDINNTTNALINNVETKVDFCSVYVGDNTLTNKYIRENNIDDSVTKRFDIIESMLIDKASNYTSYVDYDLLEKYILTGREYYPTTKVTDIHGNQKDFSDNLKNIQYSPKGLVAFPVLTKEEEDFIKWSLEENKKKYRGGNRFNDQYYHKGWELDRCIALELIPALKYPMLTLPNNFVSGYYDRWFNFPCILGPKALAILSKLRNLIELANNLAFPDVGLWDFSLDSMNSILDMLGISSDCIDLSCLDLSPCFNIGLTLALDSEFLNGMIAHFFEMINSLLSAGNMLLPALAALLCVLFEDLITLTEMDRRELNMMKIANKNPMLANMVNGFYPYYQNSSLGVQEGSGTHQPGKIGQYQNYQQLVIKSNEPISLESSDFITIKSPSDVSIDSSTDVIIKSGSSVYVGAPNINVKASGSLALQGSSTNIKGAGKCEPVASAAAYADGHGSSGYSTPPGAGSKSSIPPIGAKLAEDVK